MPGRLRTVGPGPTGMVGPWHPYRQSQDGIPPPRQHRPEGQRAQLRELGHVRHPAGHQPGSSSAWPPPAMPAATSSTTPRRTPAARARRSWARRCAELGWPRWSYVVTTKVFWGLHGRTPNMSNTLNRKYLMQAIDGSLERFGLDFVDILYCHRADPDTPLEETVWAMSDIIDVGQGAVLGHERVDRRRDPRRDRDRRAAPPAQAGHRAEPVQPARAQEGRESTTPASTPTTATATRSGARWHPACSPASTRTASPRTRAPRSRATAGWPAADRRRGDRPGREAAADRRSPRLLDGAAALAWCTKNPNVSTVITGASKVEPGRAELRGARRHPAHHRRGQGGDGVASLA